MDFIIREVKDDEFETLMHVMNVSYGFKHPVDQFEHILPKLYFKGNNRNIHYGLYINDNLISVVGIYPSLMRHNDKEISVACIGGVCTLPKFRNKGYCSKLMEYALKECEKNNYTMLFLTGKKSRYNRFGFENAGRKLEYIVNRKSIKRVAKDLHPVLHPLKEDDKEIIKECFKLYKNLDFTVDRTEDNFYKYLLTWNNIPYYVTVDGQFVGYCCLRFKKYLCELGYVKGHRNDVLKAALGHKFRLYCLSSTKEYNDELLPAILGCRVRDDVMYKILNLEVLVDFLNIDPIHLENAKKKDELTLVRWVFGNSIDDNKYGDIIHVEVCDRS
ncbi:MAG: GNAT family N-acetyltransferase [Bacilli bacterium]|nr:GNAT family N-acetyltransferase [Bacilli bacterium]